MLFNIVTFVAGLALVAAAGVPGQCPSGFPEDGLFSACALKPSWTVAAHVNTSTAAADVEFVANLDSVPSGLGLQPRRRVYVAQLSPLNANLTESGNPNATATITVTGDRVEIVLDATGLDRGIVHVAHVHGGNMDASCPTDASDTNHDGVVDVIEGVPSYGPILIPLDGDISSQLSGDSEPPMADDLGDVSYRGVGSLALMEIDLHSPPAPAGTGLGRLQSGQAIDFSQLHVAVHGIDSSVMLPGTVQSIVTPAGAPVPATASVPVLCGALELVFDSATQDNSGADAGCALRLPGYTTVYQKLAPALKFADYRLHACGKALGNSECRVEVRDHFNRVVDSVQIRPTPVLDCTTNDTTATNDNSSSSSSSSSPLCHALCSDAGWTTIIVRYLGASNTDLTVRRKSDADSANWLHFADLAPGQEITLSAADFAEPLPANNATAAGPQLLPTDLEFVTSVDGLVAELPMNCTQYAALARAPVGPGQSFGDIQQFRLVQADAVSGPVCPVEEVPGARQCACEDEVTAQEFCVESSAGFVALPDHTYFLGLTSQECGCVFDNVCLSRDCSFSAAWWDRTD